MKTTKDERKENFLKKRNEVIKMERMEIKEERKATTEELERVLYYLAEINTLKETTRTGWRHAGVPENIRDSVAEHVALTSQWAYILGRMTGLKKVDALACAGMAVFHDNPESRLGDIDRSAARYLDVTKAFLEALKDQVGQLPKQIAKEIFSFVMEVESGESQKAAVVRDADILERALRAKIYAETLKFKSLGDFFDVKEERKLQTAEAKRIMELIRKKRGLSNYWLKGLKTE